MIPEWLSLTLYAPRVKNASFLLKYQYIIKRREKYRDWHSGEWVWLCQTFSTRDLLFHIKSMFLSHYTWQRKQRFLHNTRMTALVKAVNLYIACTVLSKGFLCFIMCVKWVHKNKRNRTSICIIQMLWRKNKVFRQTCSCNWRHKDEPQVTQMAMLQVKFDFRLNFLT